jgi:hypothetical protein
LNPNTTQEFSNSNNIAGSSAASTLSHVKPQRPGKGKVKVSKFKSDSEK